LAAASFPFFSFFFAFAFSHFRFHFLFFTFSGFAACIPRTLKRCGSAEFSIDELQMARV